MARKVIVSGLLGMAVLVVWTFLVNGIFGFRAGIDMNRVDAESEVYGALKECITEPGRYSINPEVTSEGAFPEGEPVFSVLYSGTGHESAGKQMIVGLAIFLVLPLTGAWMLSRTSTRTLSSYGRKVLFFTAIGLMFALHTDLSDTFVGGYPLADGLLLGVHDIVLWTVVGFAVAWQMKPEEARD